MSSMADPDTVDTLRQIYIFMGTVQWGFLFFFYRNKLKPCNNVREFGCPISNILRISLFDDMVSDSVSIEADSWKE